MDTVPNDASVPSSSPEAVSNQEPTLFSEILTPEQQALIEVERDIGSIVLSDDGELMTTRGTIETDDVAKQWATKPGVLSAGRVNGTLAVIYNVNTAIPEGISNLKEKGRAGEFDPESDMAYTDVSGTFSFLDDKYKPSWVQQNVRHELRHALVMRQDRKYSRDHEVKGVRTLDGDELRAQDPEALRQLTYLDELHAQFLDVIEGDIQGHASFRTPESNFYSTEAQGPHGEVSSTTEIGRAEAIRLFHKLQGIILLQRMGEQGHMEAGNIGTCAYAAGVVLATERSLSAAATKVDALWKEIMQREGMSREFEAFLTEYQPAESGNTPELNNELRTALSETELSDDVTSSPSERPHVMEMAETDAIALNKVRDRLDRLAHGEDETVPDQYQATERMTAARAFFEEMGIPIDPDGFISANLTPEQIAALKKWSDETFVDSIHMPDEDTFYRKVLLGTSLWRQRDGESVNYLLGKGVGLEVSVRGQVLGRAKKPDFFSYRTHSDFELYDVEYQRNEQGGNISGKRPYSDAFFAVFGGQEFFPPDRTKGLRNIPEGFLTETAEVVDLGGVEVLVPQLELQFLDKWEKSGSHDRPEGTDAEVLARQYDLDRDRLYGYLDRFIIQPKVAEIQARPRFDPQWHLDRLSRQIAFTREQLIEGGAENPTIEQVLTSLNQNMRRQLEIHGQGDTMIGGVRLSLWRDLTPEQVGEGDKIMDEEFIRSITEQMQANQQQIIAALGNKHSQLDELLERKKI